ncbi:MAG: site-specific integrase, partial [Bacteroidales bacterium]
MCRDIWIFSYLCNGINMADLCRLRYSNISDGKISYNRQKTIRTDKDKTKIVAIMLPEMQRIIDQWGNKRVKA